MFPGINITDKTMNNLVALTEKLVVDPYLPQSLVHAQQPLQVHLHLLYPLQISSILGAGQQLQMVGCILDIRIQYYICYLNYITSHLLCLQKIALAGPRPARRNWPARSASMCRSNQPCTNTEGFY